MLTIATVRPICYRRKLLYFYIILFYFQFKPFDLAISGQQTQKSKKPYAYNSEDEQDAVADSDNDDFEIDSTALKEILTNTGIKVKRVQDHSM